MDTSEEYVKMCEEVKEIQEIRKNKRPLLFADIWEKGDWIANPKLEKVWVKSSNKISSKLIWLPRQDQLQEMVIGESRDRFSTKAMTGYLIGAISDFA